MTLPSLVKKMREAIESMPKNFSLRDKVCVVVTTVAGTGYTPGAPGTAGAFVALILIIIIRNHWILLGLTIISLILSFVYIARAEEIFQEKDSRKIVIDDFCGMLITLLFIPLTTPFIVTGFFLFRLTDILKVPPADTIEKYPGAVGVVGDDIVAGLYANLMLQVVRILL